MTRRLIPTPLHGWRAFWGEVGIIVLGVLIALAAQQLVEDWSDRQRADRALRAITGELAQNDRGFRTFIVSAPCVYAQIDAIEAQLAAGRTAPLTLYREEPDKPGFVVRMPSFAFSNSTWEAIDGIDTMRLLDPDLVETASSYFGRIENLRHFNRDAVAVNARANALAHVMPQSEGDRLRAIEGLEQLREDMFRLTLNAEQMRSSQATMGIVLPESMAMPPNGAMRAFCRAHNYPIGALKPATPG